MCHGEFSFKAATWANSGKITPHLRLFKKIVFGT